MKHFGPNLYICGAKDRTMVVTVLLFILGLAMVIGGAEALVGGASAMARRFGLSEFLIGATIVGIGTSMPELVVSVLGAIRGSADIAVGNVVGSNLFNTLLILGVTALIAPLAFTKANIRRDIPLCIAASLVFAVFAISLRGGVVQAGSISRIEGGILLAAFAGYLWYSFKTDDGSETSTDEKPTEKKPLWLSIVMVIGGLAGLVFGGHLFVDNAVLIAQALHVSESIIANTIMAGGTSAPELAVCIVAALKGRNQMAIGNIIGSNISNILLIIGASAVIGPLSVDHVNLYGVTAVALSSLLLLLSTLPHRKSRLTRPKGLLFILIYAAYLWLIMR